MVLMWLRNGNFLSHETHMPCLVCGVKKLIGKILKRDENSSSCYCCSYFLINVSLLSCEVVQPFSLLIKWIFLLIFIFLLVLIFLFCEHFLLFVLIFIFLIFFLFVLQFFLCFVIFIHNFISSKNSSF